MDSVVAHTHRDETVREAVSVFIDHANHAKTLLEQGGPMVFPVDIDKAPFSGAPAPLGLSADEKVAYEHLQFV